MNATIVTLDVRADFRAGREPLSRILSVVAELQLDQSLRLLAPFEPVPLYALLGRQGFQYTARSLSASDWEVLFTRRPGPPSIPVHPALPPSSRDEGGGSSPSVIELDARGLEPPQPLVKILEALCSLPAQTELRARTDRRPLHLYAQLEARDFTVESEEQSDGSFITHIHRR